MSIAGKYQQHGLHFRDVSYRRGEKLLFADLSFSLLPGEVYLIQGDNGAGKTSVLRLAAGLTRAESGALLYENYNGAADAGSLIAYQGHGNALEPSMTAQEDLSFWLEIYDHDTDPDDLMDHVGLNDQKHVKTSALSAGQKRRLAFARLKASERPIWLLDEPMAALDKAGKELTAQLINSHIDIGGSAIIATHSRFPATTGKRKRIVLETGP